MAKSMNVVLEEAPDGVQFNATVFGDDILKIMDDALVSYSIATQANFDRLTAMQMAEDSHIFERLEAVCAMFETNEDWERRKINAPLSVMKIISKMDKDKPLTDKAADLQKFWKFYITTLSAAKPLFHKDTWDNDEEARLYYLTIQNAERLLPAVRAMVASCGISKAEIETTITGLPDDKESDGFETFDEEEKEESELPF